MIHTGGRSTRSHRHARKNNSLRFNAVAPNAAPVCPSTLIDNCEPQSYQNALCCPCSAHPQVDSLCFLPTFLTRPALHIIPPPCKESPAPRVVNRTRSSHKLLQ